MQLSDADDRAAGGVEGALEVGVHRVEPRLRRGGPESGASAARLSRPGCSGSSACDRAVGSRACHTSALRRWSQATRGLDGGGGGPGPLPGQQHVDGEGQVVGGEGGGQRGVVGDGGHEVERGGEDEVDDGAHQPRLAVLLLVGGDARVLPRLVAEAVVVVLHPVGQGGGRAERRARGVRLLVPGDVPRVEVAHDQHGQAGVQRRHRVERGEDQIHELRLGRGRAGAGRRWRGGRRSGRWAAPGARPWPWRRGRSRRGRRRCAGAGRGWGRCGGRGA